ncbi:MAG TPA: hypothetical protein DD473_06285 [Planctomycetaceae bacterium]|nr:hypothetical protein [Planctomycetaceae bacterium]
MNVSKAIARARLIPGHMTSTELTLMASLAADLPPGSRWAEVGTLCGRSLLAVGLAASENTELVSVDVNWGSERRANVSAHDVFHELASTRCEILAIHALRASSHRAVETFRDHWFDVVFIDAAHDYESVNQDIQLWLPKVKPGGLLCGHDFSRDWPGVIRAVNELLPQRKIQESIWMYRVDPE